MAYDATVTVGATFSPAEKAFNRYKSHVEGSKISPGLSLGKITSDFRKFEQSLDAATARVVAFTATTGLIYGVGNAFTKLTQDAIKIESTMARIQAIFGSTSSETKKFQENIFKTANDLSVSFYDVANAAEEFSRQGLDLNKTLEATRAATIVAKLSGAELKGVIEGLTATLSTFNDGTLDYIQVANKLVALDSAFATSAAGITEGLKRVSGVASEAGLSFDQTAAAITALKQVTGRSEAVIGNSLKSIFTSLQTEKVQKDLASLGVETKDASGEFRNLIDVLSDLSKVYSTLGDSQKTLIAQKIGKTYQANAFQGILKSFETGTFSKALDTSKSAGSSAEDRIDQLNKTTEAALQRLGNNFTKLGSTLGDKLGKPLVDTVSGYLNSIADVANTTFGDGKTIGGALVNGLKNMLEGPGLIVIGLALGKLLARIAKESGQALKSVVGLQGRKENIARVEEFIASNLTEQNKLDLERIKNLTSIAAQQKAILAIMEQQLATQEKAQLAGSLQPYGVNLQSLNADKARSIAKKIPNRANGDMGAVNEALIREAIDIKNGVGGARSTAIPLVKTLNLGKGPQKVVVNSDEKIVPNFAGSGQHAILNREMMGYAKGKLTKKQLQNLEDKNLREAGLFETYIDRENKRRLSLSKKIKSNLSIGVVKNPSFESKITNLIPDEIVRKLNEISRTDRMAKSGIYRFPGQAPFNPNSFRKNLDFLSAFEKSFIPTRENSRIKKERESIRKSEIRERLLSRRAGLSSPLPSPAIYNEFSGIPNVIYGSGAASSAFTSASFIGKGPNSVGSSALKNVTTPVPQNITSISGFNISDPRTYAYRNIGQFGVSKPNIPKKHTSEMVKSLVSLGYSKKDINKLSPSQAYRILNPSSDFSKAPIGSSSLGGVETKKVQVTRPVIDRTGATTATLQGNGISNLRAIQPITSGRESFINSLLEEQNAKSAKAQRINSIIEKGGTLTGSASKFIKQNPSYFPNISKKDGIFRKIKNSFNQDRAMGIGFTASFLGGSIAESFKTKNGEDTQTSRAIGSISQGVGIGSLAGAFGKLPGIIGLSVGALTGLNDALGENTDKFNGLTAKHEDLQKKYQEEASAISLYQQNFESLTDAISSGSEKAAKSAKENISKALAAISDSSVRNKIVGSSSVEDLNKNIFAISDQRNRELAASQALVTVGRARQDGRRSFLGQVFSKQIGRDYASDQTINELSDQLIKSIDFSKIKGKIKGRGDLPEEAQKALSILSERYKGEEIIIDRIQKHAEALSESTSAIEKMNKVIKVVVDSNNLIDQYSNKASYEISRKNIQRGIENSTLSYKVASKKPFISELAAANAEFLIEKNKRNQSFQSQVGNVNQSIIEKAKELTKDRSFSFEKIKSIQNAFSSFGNSGDLSKFLDDFGKIIGTDNKELIKFSQGQYFELQKLTDEFKAGNLEAVQQNKILIEEIKRNSLLKLFGGTQKFESGKITGGLSAILKGPEKNKYDRINLPYTQNEYSTEQARVLKKNNLKADAIIERAKYLQENGYFGNLDQGATQDQINLRNARIESERKSLIGALETRKRSNARDYIFSQAGSYINQINEDSKKFLGFGVINGGQKKEIAGYINQGTSESLAKAEKLIADATKEISDGYKIRGNKDQEIQNIKNFRNFLLDSGTNLKDIPNAAQTEAKNIISSQNPQIDILNQIKVSGDETNLHLSKIADLMISQQAKVDAQSKVNEYSSIVSDLNKTNVEAGVSADKFSALVNDYNIQNKGTGRFENLDDFKNRIRTDIKTYESMLGEKSSFVRESAQSGLKSSYEFINRANQIESLDSNRKRYMELKSKKESYEKDFSSQIEGVKKTFIDLGNSIGEGILKKIAPQSGNQGSTSQVSVDVNASVVASNLFNSNELQSAIESAVAGYIKKNWPSNSGGKKWTEIPSLPV